MSHCQYCANSDEKLDAFGYCIKYGCFERSGKKLKLDELVKRAGDIMFMPDTYGQLGTVVTNRYSHRTRKANDVMRDAEREFGFVPLQVISKIPEKHREQWDKNVRW